MSLVFETLKPLCGRLLLRLAMVLRLARGSRSMKGGFGVVKVYQFHASLVINRELVQGCLTR